MSSSSSSAVRVAVVGAGYWGPNIIRNLQENPHCDLIAVCDQDLHKLGVIGKRFKTIPKLLSDFSALLADPSLDAIAIVTEINSHYALAKAALEAGKHVFVEKPLATTPAECEALGKLAKQRGKTLMVGHTFIYNPAVEQLKAIADSGVLGDIYYLHAQRLNLGRIQTSVNALWSLAVHDVAIALYLFGELPVSVRAWGNGFINAGVEDLAFVNLNFPSGRLAHIHASWLDPEKKRQVTLVGSKQMAIYDDVSLDRKITLFDKGIDKVLMDSPMAEYKNYSEFQLLTRTGDVHIPHLNFVEPLKVEMQHFIDCIQGKVAKPLTGWKEGMAVVKVLQAAQDSLSQDGQTIHLNWDDNAHA